MSHLLVGSRQRFLQKHQPHESREDSSQISQQELDRVGEAIRRSAQLDTLFNSLAEIVIVYNSEGIITRANPLAVQILGKNPVGKSKRELSEACSAHFPDGRRVPEDELPATRALQGKIVRGERYLVGQSNGKEISVLASATPLYDQGQLAGAVSIWTDITEREQILAQLEIERARSELRATMSQALLEVGLDYTRVLQTFALRISEIYGDACIIRLSIENEQRLEPIAYYHPDPGILNRLRAVFSEGPDRLEEGLAGTVYREGKGMLFQQTSSQEMMAFYPDRYRAWLEQFSIHSLLIVPIRAYQKRIGTLTVMRSKVDVSYTEQDQAFFQDLADRAGLAIENARLHKEIQRMATIDPLTNVNNQRAFFELGKHEINRFLRYGRPLSVMMIDIDQFKKINDTYGHAIGDQVLQVVARTLSAKTRSLDIIGRNGGDEFAVLLPETDKYEAMDIGYRMLKDLHEEKVISRSETIRISLSLGICQSPQYFDDLEGLLDQADQAMYQAKKKGGDRIELV